ncbi:hypothetical protein K1719_027258 [Acacia pycnantha]|nr:hypothetical protein K1719_027258 [Acacia pycnantha]
MGLLLCLSIFILFILPILHPSLALDSLRQSQFISDNGTTLVSKDGTFELGFFAPGTSNRRYLGIWYKNIPVQTVVWVANRLNPINDDHFWRSCSVPKQHCSLVYKFHCQGTESDRPALGHWKSCGMKFGWDFKTGWQWNLTAWKSPDDPSPGDLTDVKVLHAYPETYMIKGNKKFYRFGPWNGNRMSGSPAVKPNSVYQFTFVNNESGIYYMDVWNNNSVLTRSVLNQTQSTQYRYVWEENIKTWQIYSTKPEDYCDTYGLCGQNGNCIISESPVCRCLKGFKPKSPQDWNLVDWTEGCVRNKPLNCSEKYKDGFIKLTGMKVPDTTQTWLDQTMNLEQCRRKCLENCSCTAYTNSDVRGGGSGCALWFGDLIDVRYYASGGQDLYVRMDASELESGKKRKLTMIVTFAVGAIFALLLVGGCIFYRVRRNRIAKSQDGRDDIPYRESPDDNLDLPLFDLATIASVTDNFSNKNKIGEGGFGPVYWGKLSNGQEIAVKRLSVKSRQGLVEFKNEVKFIAKLQHRNLVKLLGCCIHEEEKMLVYEYMPNKSLDSFIFDETKGKWLDWSKRFDIILGIGREEQTEGNTNRVVRTYGYMAPEYAADGLYSVKSDVFSYDILVLEILCGKKNRGFYLEDSKHNLIGHAWILWKEGNVLELIDKNIEETCHVSKILRCIHVSLLCVQQHPENRPTIALAVLMLESEVELPQPKQPGFFQGKDSVQPHTSHSSCQKQSSSINDDSMSLLEPR